MARRRRTNSEKTLSNRQFERRQLKRTGVVFSTDTPSPSSIPRSELITETINPINRRFKVSIKMFADSSGLISVLDKAGGLTPIDQVVITRQDELVERFAEAKSFIDSQPDFREMALDESITKRQNRDIRARQSAKAIVVEPTISRARSPGAPTAKLTSGSASSRRQERSREELEASQSRLQRFADENPALAARMREIQGDSGITESQVARRRRLNRKEALEDLDV